MKGKCSSTAQTLFELKIHSYILFSELTKITNQCVCDQKDYGSQQMLTVCPEMQEIRGKLNFDKLHRVLSHYNSTCKPPFSKIGFELVLQG